MVYVVEAGNGQAVGICVAEVESVPYYELINHDLDKANREVQTAFAQIINGFSRQMEQEKTSLEFLWRSVPAKDQTYAAQVEMYVIFRMLGNSQEIDRLKGTLESFLRNFSNEVAGLNYEIAELEKESDYLDFMKSLESKNNLAVYAVAKKERILTMPMYGYIYYNDVVQPSENVNTALITNALSNYPDSVVSFQVIPTSYTDLEVQMLGLMKNNINLLATNLRMQRGPRLDMTVKRAVSYYEQMAMVSSEPCFYYNFVIYSDANGATALGSKIIEQLETDDKEWDSSFELVDASTQMKDPGSNFMVSSWVVSNTLVYQLREKEFWNADNAPTHMLRMRYLLSPRELKSVLKLPIDDGNAVGLESRRTQRNIEKLNNRILEEGSFKLGRIRNLLKLKDSGSMDAGIPLDDFTKHGLIVGMPGSGKTNFSLGMLLQFWRDYHIPFLAIEPTKNEYRSLVDAIPDLQVFTPGKGDISNFIINPFIPPDNVTVETYAPGLMTAFKAAFQMPSPLPNVFSNAINSSYVKYGWKKRSTTADSDAEPFGMYEFIRVFKQVASNLGYKGESKANIESAGVLRLISLIEQNSNIYDTIHSIPLKDLLSKPTVIELNAISDKEQKSLIMAFLLIMICVHTKNNVIGDGVLKNIILIDEAHVLLDKSDAEAGGTKATTISTIEDMIAEVRSLGTGIIIADQSPTKMGKYIVANTNVKVMFKLVEKESRDIMSVTTNMSAREYEELARLGVGQAMIHFGRLNSPLQIATYNVEDVAPIRKVVLDDEIRKLSTYWRVPEHEKLLIPYRECKFSAFCSVNCSQKVRDDAEYIASRLLQDYPEKLKDKKEFVKFLVSMNAPIIAIIESRSSMSKTKRMLNCVKIKYFRKALLEVDFCISEDEYNMIMNHPKFLFHTTNEHG